jgi:hypothetical protein
MLTQHLFIMTTITTSNRLFIKGVSTEARLDDIEQIVRQSCGGYGNFVKVELAPYRGLRGVSEPPRFTNAIAHFVEWNFSKDDMSLRESLMTGGYIKIYHTDATRTTPARYWKAYLFDPTRTTTQDQDRAQDVDRRNAAQMQSRDRRPPHHNSQETDRRRDRAYDNRDRLPELRREQQYDNRDRLPERRNREQQYDNRDRLPERRREQSYEQRERAPHYQREQSYDRSSDYRREQSYDNRDRLPERRNREQSYDNRERTPNYRREQSYDRRGHDRSESRDRSPDHRRVVREGRYRQETDRDYVSNVKPAPKRPPLARQQPAIREQPVVEQKKQELDFDDDCSSCTNSQDAVHLNDIHEAMDYGEVAPSRKRKVKIISSRMMEKITEDAKAAITSPVSALSL